MKAELISDESELLEYFKKIGNDEIKTVITIRIMSENETHIKTAGDYSSVFLIVRNETKKVGVNES